MSSAWAVLRLIPLLMVSVALSASPAAGQPERSRISGYVRDETGGAIPRAAVRAVHVPTRIVRTAQADGTGLYVMTELVPGVYELTVESAGFRGSVQTGIALDAASHLTLDVTLNVGSVTDRVVVPADRTALQTETTIRRAIETREVEQLPLSGRNPINLAVLKAGVRGARFNAFNPDSLSMGDYNINGGRTDENLITLDGVIALSPRAQRTIIGTQDVNAIQEVQVLTANYLPEFGRSSGGQIRFVTKSGSTQLRGGVSGVLRDDRFDANTWSRNRSLDRAQNEQPAPYSYSQVGFNLGGPMAIVPDLGDTLFFFWAEEWIRRRRTVNTVQTVPTVRMRQGDFGELLDPANPFFRTPRLVLDPMTGVPFPGNVVPRERLSAVGLALLNAYPEPTAGFAQGSGNWLGTSTNPSDTRKDTVRLDYQPREADRVTVRYSHFDWTSVDPFRGCCTNARTDWDRPNSATGASWTHVLGSRAVNELAVGYARASYVIDVFREGELYSRSRYGIDFPYILPGKDIEDKIPTISLSNFGTLDGGPYPASSRAPIHTWSDTLTWLEGRHTIKAGAFLEYSGEDNADQINVQPVPGDTNNQNGRFEFTDGRSGGTGLAVANAALGLFTSYGEIGQRSRTSWRTLATDLFVQDSWKLRPNLTVEGGVRYVLWPPWHAALNNAAMFHPSFYDPRQAATIDPRTGSVLGGDRYNGIVLPGAGWPERARETLDIAQSAEFDRLFRGEPNGFGDPRRDVFEPRLGVAYSPGPSTVVRAGAGVFHSRVMVNDSTLLGGNPPIQPRVTVSNGVADQPGGATAQTFPLAVTAQDLRPEHPTAYVWSAGVQREIPWQTVVVVDVVARRGIHLQRERNINQLPAGTIQANPGVNRDALRPFTGFGTIRLSENAGTSTYRGLQVNIDRRATNGVKLGLAYTYSRSMDNGSDKRAVLFNAYDDRASWGPSDFDRTHDLKLLYIYDLPFLRETPRAVSWLFGGWQLSGVLFAQSGQPLSVGTDEDRAGAGDTTAQPYNLIGDHRVRSGGQGFSEGAGLDGTFWFNPDAFAPPVAGTFGNAPRNLLRGPGFWTWDVAVLKDTRLPGGQTLQLRAEAFNLLNHANLENPVTNPRNANFGRVIAKRSGAEDSRNLQLSLRLSF